MAGSPIFVEEDGVAVWPGGGCDSHDGHGLEEELEGLMKCRWHVLEDDARDAVRACRSVVWGAAEGLLQDSRGDASGYHHDCVFADG